MLLIAGLKYVGETADHLFGNGLHKYYMWCCVNWEYIDQRNSSGYFEMVVICILFMISRE